MNTTDWIGRRFVPVEEPQDAAPGIIKARDLLAPPSSAYVVLKRATEPLARRALEREVSYLLELDHPSLRQVRAHARGDGVVVAALEYVDGVDLKTYLGSHPDQTRSCALGLLRSLLYLHAQGLAHGDLKPSNVLVQDGKIRLIDLGLMSALGAPRQGGTGQFLAPEYLKGGPTSVGGDLFALGKTLEQTSRGIDGRVDELIRACSHPDPSKRPASADGALGALGAVPHPLDRRGQPRRVGGFEALDLAGQHLLGLAGTTLVIEAPAGSGRSRLVGDALKPLLLRSQAVAQLSLKDGHDPFPALAHMLLPASPSDGQRKAALSTAALARAGVALVLDDGDAASAAVRSLIVVAATTVAAIGCGTLIVVGADQKLREELEKVGAQACVLEPLTADQVLEVISLSGGLHDTSVAAVVAEQTGGRAGLCARVAARLAQQPQMSPAEVARIVAAEKERTEPRRGAQDELDAEHALVRAQESFDRGASTEAAELLLKNIPHLSVSPKDRPEAAALLARCQARRGELALACEVVTRLQSRASAALKLDAAHWYEQLGLYEQALDLAEPFARAQKGSSRAAATMARSALGLGDPEGAEQIAADALNLATEPATTCRLLCVRSDAALMTGHPKEAIAHAKAAEQAAAEQDDPTMAPQALARQAAGLALSGKPKEARARYEAAYLAAEKAGDVVGLVPYIQNLATAEHALGDFSSALAHYQQAARLAGNLGRIANRAAALVNWASLLVDLGATEEATPVLDDAQEAAQQSGSAIYGAQAQLVRAVLVGKGSPEQGQRLAEEAQKAFLDCGAARQALEARLLWQELGAQQGSGIQSALRFTGSHAEELEKSGLGPRGALLAAQAHLAEGNVQHALESANSAAAGALEDGDHDLEARALVVAAGAHSRLGTGAEGPIAARAKEALGAVAATLPEGLRERFLEDPSRASASHFSDRGRAPTPAQEGLGPAPSRLLVLVRRVLLENDEKRILDTAVDEAVALVHAERAFLLLPGKGKGPFVAVARNMDRQSIGRSGAASRYSRSVAQRVLTTGQRVVTASAADDPALSGARSIMDLGLRSILCVPIRGPNGVAGALYLDHRFETGRFGPQACDLIQALADIIGLALENSRLHRRAEKKAKELEKANRSLRKTNERKSAEVDRLELLLEQTSQSVRDAPGGMVGGSEGLRQALDVARRVSASNLPVLVEGESGTGKELLAKYLHDSSLRRDGPFVAVNCGAMPDTLLESELFGHLRGAFTGATKDHMGLFRAASSGTVFLDEIGEMSEHMQSRLLRVLQEGEVWPVGGDKAIHVDVRVVAATNRELESEVDKRRFRQDLFFRLVGVRIVLPPLRERLDDIPVLARAMMEQIAKEPGMRKARLSRPAMRELLRRPWPGNVRELKQTLRRAVLLAEGETVEAKDLELSPAVATRRDAIRGFDKKLVVQALRASGNNKSAAARALGISRSTLHRWLDRYDLK